MIEGILEAFVHMIAAIVDLSFNVGNAIYELVFSKKINESDLGQPVLRFFIHLIGIVAISSVIFIVIFLFVFKL